MALYPPVKDPDKVGEYPALVNSGGGFVWDDVLEYRVWCHACPTDSTENGDDFYYVFDNYEEAKSFADNTPGCEEPLALILQVEHINEPEPGKFIHVKNERITEWPVEFLLRPRRTEHTIPDFLSPGAPINRLDILRGLA